MALHEKINGLSDRAGTGMALAAARGAAIIMVVLYHTDVVLPGYFSACQPFARTLLVLRYIAMPTFFISVGMSISTANRGRDFISIINKRVVNYLYLYFLWVTISLVVSSFVEQMNIFRPDSLLHLIKVYVLPGNPLWFLYSLVILIGALPIFVRLRAGWQVAWMAALAITPLLPHMGRWEIASCTHNAIIFYVGFLFRAPIMSLLRARSGATFAVATPLYIGLLYGLSAFNLTDLPFVTEILSLIAVLAALSFWMICPSKLMLSLMAMIGRAALPIYLLHDFWVHVFLALSRRGGYSVSSVFDEYALPAGVAASAIAVSFLLKTILRRVPGVFGVSATAYFMIAPLSERALRAIASAAMQLPPLFAGKIRQAAIITTAITPQLNEDICQEPV